jgi:RNA recognition motif-containing protein
MGKKLYVGNLSYNLTSEELSSAFSAAGQVASVKIITDMNTGRSKGFGFVEMADEDGAQKAIAELDGKDVGGRALRVSEAKPQPERGSRPQGDRPRGGGGFGGGRGGFGGGGNRGDRGNRRFDE